jgi:hypothetical protein
LKGVVFYRELRDFNPTQQFGETPMWDWGRSALFKAVLVSLLLIGVSWFALDYFIATGPKGTTLDYYGQRYRHDLVKAGIRRNSDLYFMLRYHLDRARARLDAIDIPAN